MSSYLPFSPFPLKKKGEDSITLPQTHFIYLYYICQLITVYSICSKFIMLSQSCQNSSSIIFWMFLIYRKVNLCNCTLKVYYYEINEVIENIYIKI